MAPLPQDPNPLSRPKTTKNIYKRKSFDDRAQSAVSLLLKVLRALPTGNDKIKQLRRRVDVPHASHNTVLWSETTLISKVLNSPRFLEKFGLPTALELSPNYIFVGTTLGRVAAFNYHQKLDFILDLGPPDLAESPKVSLVPLPVTCVAISASGLFACAGHADGKLIVWEVPSKPAKMASPDVVMPYDHIRSVSLRERAASSEILGHLHGVPVNTVTFVGDLHQNLVSSDVSGLVLFHHGFQRLFRKKFVLQRLLGHHVATLDDILDRFCVHDCQVLPIGTAPQLTDHIGLLAVVTTNLLVVISICSLNNDTVAYPKTHFKATRPHNVHIDGENSPLGCLAWYPSITSSKSGKNGKNGMKNAAKNAKLAYSWNNILTILEVDYSRIPDNAMAILDDLKDKDRAIPNIELMRTARWTAPLNQQRIISLKWLNLEIVTALITDPDTAKTTLYFLYYRDEAPEYSLELVGTDDLDSQQVAKMQLSESSDDLNLRLFNSSVRIFRHKPVVLADSHAECLKTLLIGTISKWADRLMELIKKEEFAPALLCAYDFYCSNHEGDLLLSGLPHTKNERHRVVEPFLLDIMRLAIVPVFGENSPFNTEDCLWLYFHLTEVITKTRGGVAQSDLLEILDTIYEVVGNRSLFFSVLEHFIIAGGIRTLPPIVLESLVGNYTHEGNGQHLTELICVLDPGSLNIDLTLRLCEAHNLRECTTYIWTAILKDYSRPFYMLMGDMDLEKYTNDEKNLIFTFMSYILCGRKFPLETYMSLEEEDVARNEITRILFSLHEIKDKIASEYHVNVDSRNVFPYLLKLLTFNAFETLATLNEFFENPCLNTDAKGELNRQYVIEALLDIYTANKDVFNLADHVYLAIFLARNYPKYFQFIRISDSVLEKTVEMLCSSPVECHDDAELALESLLPVYDTKSDDFFMERMKTAKFYRVAFELSRAKQKYSNALEIWLQQQKDANATDIHDNFPAFADIVSHTFNNRSVSHVEQARLFHIIEENFEVLIARYPEDMVLLANSHNTKMHHLVLKCNNKELAFLYLKTLFNLAQSHSLGHRRAEFLGRYIELASELAKEEVCDLTDRYSLDIKNAGEVVEKLREKLETEACFDSLAILSRNFGNYEKAMDEIEKALLLLTKNGDWRRLRRVISIGISICEKENRCWERLVRALVSIKAPETETETETEKTTSIPEEVNQSIYRCFRKIIDYGEKVHNPQFFTDILQGIMEQATLSHVKEVIQETLTSFYFDSEIHNITLLKLNGRIRKHMNHVKLDRLRGWIFKNTKCASCGKLMWGGEAQEKHVAAWESKEKARVFHEKYDREQWSECELAFFKCRHGYHSRCLEKLSSVGRCVICTQ